MSIGITKTFRIGFINKSSVDNLARALKTKGCVMDWHAANGYCQYRYDINQHECVFIGTENYDSRLESFDVTVSYHSWLPEKDVFDYALAQLGHINRPAKSTD